MGKLIQMDRKFVFGSLLAGGLIGISLITGCGSSTPEQTTAESATTEESPTTQANIPAPAPAAPAPTPSPAAQTTTPPAPTPVATPQATAPAQQSTSVGSEYCPHGGAAPLVESYETKGFNIYLCGGDGEIFYHGVDKKNGNSITLPATYRNGAGYVAVNGSTTYIINESSLTVLDNGKEILSQSVQ